MRFCAIEESSQAAYFVLHTVVAVVVQYLVGVGLFSMNNDHRFDWTKTTILDHAKTRQAREFKEAWHSLHNPATNRHIGIPPTYQKLKEHHKFTKAPKLTTAPNDAPMKIQQTKTNQSTHPKTNQSQSDAHYAYTTKTA